MTNSIFLVALIVVLITSSCDPGVQYRRIIENNSGYDLKVSVFGGKRSNCTYQYDSDSVIVKSKSEMTLAGFSGLRQTTEFDGCESCADSIVVRIIGSSTLRMTIDLNLPTVWTFTTLQTSFGSGGTCECRLQITDNDIR